MADAHDTHCCIAHGCKYCDPDCPIINGIRKQWHPCEDCYDYSEFGKNDESRQQELIDALWEEKRNPRQLSESEMMVAGLAQKYGRYKLLDMLGEIDDILGKGNMEDIQALTQVLLTLKHLP